MSAIRIELDRVPSLARAYGRMLLTRKAGLTPDGEVPRIEVHLGGVVVERRKLDAYCRLCGFATDVLPLSYPMVLGACVNVELMLTQQFPLSPLGMVHIGSTIEATRALGAEESLDLCSWVDGHRPVKRGVELDLTTTVDVAGTRVWTCVNTILVRERHKSTTPPNRGRSGQTEPLSVDTRVEDWKVPKSMGRQYARVSGDYNPIHLFGPTAKLFGFPRAIAHGLWTLARCLAALGDDLPSYPLRVEANFKRPLLLPSTVRFSCKPGGMGMAFSVHSADGRMPHLLGSAIPTQS
ncbi:MAG: hypothetical protein A2289_05685 [Deltaproteobacteria bacterium RIFOXYA12_FULL_58_15]|nr:MAG: hypothetical protein A2289_05685 [Deltaproteobacteria bacterium RIFOXYA12_FULL_58_15]OGR07524.1 MAG: hypothetical protein A2341_26485 [Deltaproteobacteria bacterium RIFOXYB12_FULL_58_9]